MVTGESMTGELDAAVEADVTIALKQRLVIERWGIIFPHLLHHLAAAMGGDNGVDLDNAAPIGTGVDSTPYTIEQLTAGVGDLIKEVEAYCIPVVDPLKWHAGGVSTQNLLLQR